MITDNHFNERNLQLTPETMELARQERINQLIGSNQGPDLKLLMAYQENNNESSFVKENSKILQIIGIKLAVNYQSTYFTVILPFIRF